MDKEQLKIVIDGKDSPVRIGSDILTLSDMSSYEFQTRDLSSFIDYIKMEGLKDLTISFDLESREAVAYPCQAIYGGHPTAALELALSKPLRALIAFSEGPHNLKATEDFLRSMIPYMGTCAHDFYKIVQNLKLQKITSIQNRRDPNGNFSFAVSRSSGVEDVEIPTDLTFVVPLFDTIDSSTNNVVLKYDIFMDYKENGSDAREPVSLSFRLESFTMEQDINKAVYQVVFPALRETGYPVFVGKIDHHGKTDSWKYQENALRIKQ